MGTFIAHEYLQHLQLVAKSQVLDVCGVSLLNRGCLRILLIFMSTLLPMNAASGSIQWFKILFNLMPSRSGQVRSGQVHCNTTNFYYLQFLVDNYLLMFYTHTLLH